MSVKPNLIENKSLFKHTTKAVIVAIALVLILASGITVAFASNPQTGNGAPSGPHYNLNIIGIEKGGSQSTTSNGHTIFVPLWGHCKIDLQMGDFQVIQPNCLDGNALFQLPNATGTGALSGDLAYSVWVRAVTSKGSASMTTCYTDTTGTYCNAGDLIVPLHKLTPPKFTDVSKQLLEVCVNGSLQPLFSASNYQAFWNYTNSGLHLAQLRFYQIPEAAATGSCSVSTVTTFTTT